MTPKAPASRRSQWPRASPGFGPGGWGLSRRTRGRLPKYLHPSRVPRLNIKALGSGRCYECQVAPHPWLLCSMVGREKRTETQKKTQFYAGLGIGEGLPKEEGLHSASSRGSGKPSWACYRPARPLSQAGFRVERALRGRGWPLGPGRRRGSQGCCKWLKLPAG